MASGNSKVKSFWASKWVEVSRLHFNSLFYYLFRKGIDTSIFNYIFKLIYYCERLLFVEQSLQNENSEYRSKRDFSNSNTMETEIMRDIC